MLRIAVCDDQPDQLVLIRAALENYFSSRGEIAEIALFDSALLFLESLEKTGGCDIALLDICMPGMLGTDVAREIRTRRDKTEIVFLTSSDEYAVDAFALKAAHYLLKPFTQAQFEEAMDRTTTRFADDRTKTLAIKTAGGEIVSLDISEIQYIESSAHCQTIHLTDGELTEARRSLARLAEELEALSPGQFISPYKGFVVNQRAVRTIESAAITLSCGASVPIVRRSFRALRDTWFDFMFEGGQKP